MMDTSRKPTLVIFDCDGVLVDSEPVSNRVMHAYLAEQFSLQECGGVT